MANITEDDPDYNSEDWEIGLPMNGAGWNRLRRIDLSPYRFPNYGKMDLARAVNTLQFKGFRGDFVHIHKPDVLPRQTVEAAWVDFLLYYFGHERIDTLMRSKGWDIGRAKAWKENLLTRGCAQRHNAEAERYWQDLVAKYPDMEKDCRRIDDTKPTEEYLGDDGCSYDDFSEDEGRPMRTLKQPLGLDLDGDMDIDEQDGGGADAEINKNKCADTGLEDDLERMEID